jgi:hypothetical protein
MSALWFEAEVRARQPAEELRRPGDTRNEDEARRCETRRLVAKLRLVGKMNDERLWQATFAYEDLANAAAPPPGIWLLVERPRRND